jgi:hypothetical protein
MPANCATTMLVSAKAGVALFYFRIWLALFKRMSCGNLLKCAGLLRWVKQSTRSTPGAVARSGKGTGDSQTMDSDASVRNRFVTSPC